MLLESEVIGHETVDQASEGIPLACRRVLPVVIPFLRIVPLASPGAEA